MQVKDDDDLNPPKSKPLTEKGKTFWDVVDENQAYVPKTPYNHFSKINRNMYNPRYQQGGQSQQPDEQQMVMQILQTIQQLSPEAQQMLMQQLQGGGQQQQQEQQYMPPQQRMGGRTRNY